MLFFRSAQGTSRVSRKVCDLRVDFAPPRPASYAISSHAQLSDDRIVFLLKTIMLQGSSAPPRQDRSGVRLFSWHSQALQKECLMTDLLRC